MSNATYLHVRAEPCGGTNRQTEHGRTNGF